MQRAWQQLGGWDSRLREFSGETRDDDLLRNSGDANCLANTQEAYDS